MSDKSLTSYYLNIKTGADHTWTYFFLNAPFSYYKFKSF